MKQLFFSLTWRVVLVVSILCGCCSCSIGHGVFLYYHQANQQVSSAIQAIKLTSKEESSGSLLSLYSSLAITISIYLLPIFHMCGYFCKYAFLLHHTLTYQGPKTQTSNQQTYFWKKETPFLHKEQQE